MEQPVWTPRVDGRVIQTYPPRGPLQQYRFDASQSFDCRRCGTTKTSKLITVADGDGRRLICNGCYGLLLAVWEIKAGDLPDNERDAALLAALIAAAPAADVERARTVLGQNGLGYPQLSPTAQLLIATSYAVRDMLGTTTGLDWSAAVIGLCKAVEVEVTRLIIEPLRGAVEKLDLTADAQDKDLSRVAKYCLGQAPPPEMGAVARLLTTAGGSRRRAATSNIIQGVHCLIAGWGDGDWLLAQDGLAAAVTTLTREYRNPAAHTEVLDAPRFEACVELVQGAAGLLPRLLAATQAQAGTEAGQSGPRR